MAEAVVLRSVKGSPLTHTEMDNNLTNPFRNLIDGLITSNDSDAAHDISVSAGVFSDSTNARIFETTSAIVKQIDVNWAEGTAAGGFPSGLTLTADTTYHYFMIAKTDGTVDSGWDTSLTATNLLADATGYTLFRRIASHLTNSSSNIKQYIQTGDEFLHQVPASNLDSTNPGTSAVTVTATTPVGIVTEVLGTFFLSDLTASTSGDQLLITSLAQTDSVPSTTLFDIFIFGDANKAVDSISRSVQSDTSAQFRIRMSFSDASVRVRILTRGWIDLRGKE